MLHHPRRPYKCWSQQRALASSTPTAPSGAGCRGFSVLKAQSEDARGERKFWPDKIWFSYLAFVCLVCFFNPYTPSLV